MKRFRCRCGQFVYFESDSCISCGSLVGFDPDTLSMRSLSQDGQILRDDDGRAFLHCNNGIQYDVCNWLRPADSTHPLCFGCQFNRTIPNLEVPINLSRWSRLESNKKRLFFTLLSLGLPLTNGHDDPENGLLLDFVEDSRSDSYRFPESFVHTGYLGGVITVNALEADDVAREAIRVEMGESYRTVLGHLRHESGHYYWSLFNADSAEKDEFRAQLGNPDVDYKSSLEHYYSNGPRDNWAAYHISTYASSHPIEDWAETWGHYLHIVDVLETATEYGATAVRADASDFRSSIKAWRDLSVALNELNRSLGIGDAYPFVVNSAIEQKLVYVDSVVSRLQRPRPATEVR